ncbi:MAG TPA: hypothetical protein DCW35_04060 [Polynucleobacter sp.]|nr:hypothetical protein [Polynucleobacter necessarius]HAT39257.1 hypothetical protein [Polynucleobacter sp.]
MEQLQIEPISQTAANQRAERCGHVSDGICVRLDSEQDYQGRAQFTDPEILRSSLVTVLLRMSSLRSPKIQHFPFIDKPLGRAIADGMQLLDELGALGEKGWKENGFAATYEQVHLALLTGLLGYVAKKDEDEKSQDRNSKTGGYVGARGIRPFI